MEGGGHILVSAAVEGAHLVLQVKDTGLGESASGNGKGFGLAQVRERLATLYGDEADADFEAVPGTGATAILRLPIAMIAPLPSSPKTSRCWRRLCRASWRAPGPSVDIAAVVGDGTSAVTQALALKPDVLFFDIRMPGQQRPGSGGGTGRRVAGLGRPFPALVFVTAYDEFAVQAFEREAVRLPAQAGQRRPAGTPAIASCAAWRQHPPAHSPTSARAVAGASAAPQAAEHLHWVRASVGNDVRLGPGG